MDLTERSVYLWTGLVLLFLAITFSKDLAIIYGIAFVLDYTIFKEYKSQITINRVPGNSGRAAMIGLIAYLVFMAIAIAIMVMLQFGAVQKSPTEAFFRAQWQAGANPLNPLFQDNPIAIMIAYGFLIPVLETRITGRILSVLLDTFRTNIEGRWWANWKLWAIFAVISLGAVFFHIQAKGITDNVALVLTFVFWMAQLAAMAYTKELESAIDLHIINNTITVAKNVLHIL